MNTNTKAYHHLDHTITLLKWTYGLASIIVGADKFFHFLVYWPKFLSPLIAQFLPSVQQGLYVMGAVEIVIGLIILSKFTRLGAYIVALWFFIIVADLLSIPGFYDIAVRDVVLGVGALALGRLVTLRDYLKVS